MSAINWTTIKNAIATAVLTATGLPSSRLRWAGQSAPEPDTSSSLPWILIGRFNWTNPGNDWTQYEDKPLTFSPKTVTLDDTTDVGASTAHGFETRDGPVHLTTTGTLTGSGLAVGTDYWVIKDSTNGVKFASTFLNADAGTFIDILSPGTGVHSIVYTAATRKAGQELKEYSRGQRRVTFDIQCFPAVPAPGQPLPDDSDPVAVLSDLAAKFNLGSIYQGLTNAGIGLLNLGEPQNTGGILNSVFFEPRAIMNIVFSTTSEVEGTETYVEYLNIAEDGGTRTVSVDINLPPNEP